MQNAPRPVSEIRQKINRVQQSEFLLNNTSSLDDVYTLLNQLSSDVLDMYPHIACRTQCNSCCKGTSMPTASPAEWEQVHDYLMRFYTPEQRQELVERIRAYYNPNREAYWQVHDTIQQVPDLEKLAEFKRVLPRLESTQCPFLVDEKCSVYMSRPAKCRAHGAFLFQLQDHVQLHACGSEVDKMEAYLEQQGSRKVTIPFWNPFESKIVNAYNPPGAVSTILPIWLVTHIQNGELVEMPNLLPDFDAFRDVEI